MSPAIQYTPPASSGQDSRIGDLSGGADGYIRLASGIIVPSTAAQGRTDLGLGTAATQPSTAFAAAAHTHIESDVTALTTDLAAKAPLASPTFTGTVTLPEGNDAAAGTASRRTLGTGATQAMQGSLAAPLASPTFTGTVTMPQTGLPDQFTANPNIARACDPGVVQTAALKPVLCPIEPAGRRNFALDSLGARVGTGAASSTWGMAIYSVTYSGTTFTCTLVVATGSLSGVTGGIVKGQVTGAPITLNFNTTLYFVAHMVSTITTLAFNGASTSSGANARQFCGALIYTGSARSSVTDWPTTIDNNAGGSNNGTGTPSGGSIVPWMFLANAAGANWQ